MVQFSDRIMENKGESGGQLLAERVWNLLFALKAGVQAPFPINV